MDSNDPRWIYNLTYGQAQNGWPCKVCDIRRDEHKSDNKGDFISVDDHDFIPALDN